MIEKEKRIEEGLSDFKKELKVVIFSLFLLIPNVLFFSLIISKTYNLWILPLINFQINYVSMCGIVMFARIMNITFKKNAKAPERNIGEVWLFFIARIFAVTSTWGVMYLLWAVLV